MALPHKERGGGGVMIARMQKRYWGEKPWGKTRKTGKNTETQKTQKTKRILDNHWNLIFHNILTFTFTLAFTLILHLWGQRHQGPGTSRPQPRPSNPSPVCTKLPNIKPATLTRVCLVGPMGQVRGFSPNFLSKHYNFVKTHVISLNQNVSFRNISVHLIHFIYSPNF